MTAKRLFFVILLVMAVALAGCNTILRDRFFPSLHEIARASLPAQSASLGAGQSFVFAFDI